MDIPRQQRSLHRKDDTMSITFRYLIPAVQKDGFEVLPLSALPAQPTFVDFEYGTASHNLIFSPYATRWMADGTFTSLCFYH
jgi:hypothetical protein